MSLLRHLYYEFKPYLPVSARMAFRRRLANRALARSHDIWPINSKTGRKPQDWPGWPGGKRFALVLTHDVEGRSGLSACPALAALEESLDFRSSFNFIPEGGYSVSPELRVELGQRGFEVGVHDLKHDGKLYRSHSEFQRAAARINSYLNAWDSVGFRSGFMHHNLRWLHHLNIAYDMSTFDTDPFEPQPDGVDTIFPFWVSNPDGSGADRPVRQDAHSGRPGYVEMPYTLPQDSTLFLLLQHKNIDIWKRKLDWIAENQGMALVNVHPDYIDFGNQLSPSRYPASFYRDFLAYVQRFYSGQFWSALPREIASLIRPGKEGKALHASGAANVASAGTVFA